MTFLTALVADDDAAMRALLARALRAFGFRVLMAADGNEAQKLAEGHDGPVHLLVTDVEMPGLTGVELAAALSMNRPELAVLLVSGRTAPGAVADAGRGRTAAFLAKPFGLDELRATVLNLTGRHAPSVSGRWLPERSGGRTT